MAGATLTTLSNILKDFYLPPVVEQLNNRVLLLQRLESRDQELFGNQAVVPLHTSRSSGVGARGEGGTLPTAGNQTYAKAVYDLKYLYGTLQVTGPSMAKTASEAGAFLQALKSEIDGLQNDLKKDVARQTWGTGDSIIATCGTTTASTTVTLASDEQLRKGQLYINMLVDIGTLAAPTTVVAGAKITDFSIANKTITIDSSVTTSSSHFVFRAGAAAASSVSYEIAGVQKIIPTSAANSFGGIDATAAGNGYWDSNRLASGGSLSIANMQQAWNTVQFKGGNVSAMYTTYGIQRQYYQLLQSQVRYTEPTTIKGGFSTLDFMGQPLIADLDAVFGNLYFCDEQHIKVFSNRDWHFLDEDGHMLKWVVGQDAWQAALARYLNLGADRRNTQLVMTGITDTTGV